MKVFSAGFDDSDFNELPRARKTAEALGVELEEIIVDAQMGMKAIPKVIWHTDFPFWDISSVPSYYAALLASKKVNMVLTGDGSDQLLAGSTTYADWKKQTCLFPEFLRTKILAKLIYLFNGFSPKNILLEKIIRNAKIESLPLEKRYSIRHSLLPFTRREQAYNPDFKSVVSDDIPSEVIAKCLAESNRDNFIDKLLYKDVLFFLQDDLLVKVDRMLAACSLEFRTPFLDIDVMNFISTIPITYKIKGIWDPNKKYILKRTFRNDLPAHVLKGKKMGFSPPQKKWMQNQFKEIMLDNLLIRNTGIEKYFNIKFVNKILEEFNKNEYVHHLGSIWALFMFELWHKTYIDSAELTTPVL